jgi:hypothetical protein
MHDRLSRPLALRRGSVSRRIVTQKCVAAVASARAGGATYLMQGEID